MGSTPAQALSAVRLVVQMNDWSLRALGPRDGKGDTSFGVVTLVVYATRLNTVRMAHRH